jgi:chromosomal replication initiation ATPase DnaA
MCDSMMARPQVAAMSVPELLRVLCLHACVPTADVLSGKREPHVVRARYRVMEALRRRGWSLKQIGNVLKRDHATVLYGLRRFSALELERIIL